MTTATTDRPAHHLSYREAAAATGLSVRHLRRLVATGAVEAMDMGGRRWLSTAGLVAAGYALNAPETGPVGAAAARTPPPDVSEEMAALRQRLAVAEAVSAERLREIERLDELVHRVMAQLPAAGRTEAPDMAGDATDMAKRRWWRRKKDEPAGDG